jgi:hypothetical protein
MYTSTLLFNTEKEQGTGTQQVSDIKEHLVLITLAFGSLLPSPVTVTHPTKYNKKL